MAVRTVGVVSLPLTMECLDLYHRVGDGVVKELIRSYRDKLDSATPEPSGEELVDRVMDAIGPVFVRVVGVEGDDPDDVRVACEEIARAAIAAMRPTASDALNAAVVEAAKVWADGQENEHATEMPLVRAIIALRSAEQKETKR